MRRRGRAWGRGWCRRSAAGSSRGSGPAAPSDPPFQSSVNHATYASSSQPLTHQHRQDPRLQTRRDRRVLGRAEPSAIKCESRNLCLKFATFDPPDAASGPHWCVVVARLHVEVGCGRPRAPRLDLEVVQVARPLVLRPVVRKGAVLALKSHIIFRYNIYLFYAGFYYMTKWT